jgi:8-oxo-dGTP diphosphatase
MTTPTPTRIGIAVVEHDGCFLVGVRGDHGPLPGMSEFPGGKCLPEECPEACAMRECREEAGLVVETMRLLDYRTHTYPHGTVDLHFWHCRPVAGQDATSPGGGFRWVLREELGGLNFPEANATVLKAIALTSEKR